MLLHPHLLVLLGQVLMFIQQALYATSPLPYRILNDSELIKKLSHKKLLKFRQERWLSGLEQLFLLQRT